MTINDKKTTLFVVASSINGSCDRDRFRMLCMGVMQALDMNEVGIGVTTLLRKQRPAR